MEWKRGECVCVCAGVGDWEMQSLKMIDPMSCTPSVIHIFNINIQYGTHIVVYNYNIGTEVFRARQTTHNSDNQRIESKRIIKRMEYA